jgi:hypothetical protein
LTASIDNPPCNDDCYKYSTAYGTELAALKTATGANTSKQQAVKKEVEELGEEGSSSVTTEAEAEEERLRAKKRKRDELAGSAGVCVAAVNAMRWSDHERMVCEKVGV